MVSLRSVARLQGYYQRRSAGLLFRRPFVVDARQPIISFTFDDFPRSALLSGGAILNSFGVAGTYYASLGLMGQDTATGRIFAPSDLKAAVEQGHELGCHTFSHCDSWQTPTKVFERSIVENCAALSEALPGAQFKTFSYPISLPKPLTKSRVARRFLCCRAGGQTYNSGTTDLNQLSAYFLEKSRDDIRAVRDVIDRNCRARGWLILATHDISEGPTRFGCTPNFFGDVVAYAIGSGARVLPVVRALNELRAATVASTVED